MPIQSDRIIAELRGNYFTSIREQIDSNINDIKNFIHKNQGAYHKYFKSELYNLQVYELFSITLGIDVSVQNFISDATQSEETKKWNIDAVRHHPLEDKSAYTIFDSNQLGFLVNLIPLMRDSHMRITTYLRLENTIENQLAVARFQHLYELIQKPYVKGKDYSAEF